MRPGFFARRGPHIERRRAAYYVGHICPTYSRHSRGRAGPLQPPRPDTGRMICGPYTDTRTPPVGVAYHATRFFSPDAGRIPNDNGPHTMRPLRDHCALLQVRHIMRPGFFAARTRAAWYAAPTRPLRVFAGDAYMSPLRSSFRIVFIERPFQGVVPDVFPDAVQIRIVPDNVVVE